jgi:hypothetical protein
LTDDDKISKEECDLDDEEKYYSMSEPVEDNKPKAVEETPRNSTMKISLIGYCKELNFVMSSEYSVAEGRALEKEFLKFFGVPARKNFFNYILIDPRKRNNSRRESILPTGTFDVLSFRDFILCSFYVGKGEGKRPLMHLYEAALYFRSKGKKSKKDNRKVEKIIDIWSSDAGVVSLQVFHCISSDEALARECLIIEALGLSNLTNIQIGQNKIRVLGFNERQRRVLGSYFLFKAYWIYVVHGDNQIRVSDVRF